MKNIGIIIKKILRLWIRNQSEKLHLRVSPKIYSLCHSYVLEKTTCVYRIKRDGIHLRKCIKKGFSGGRDKIACPCNMYERKGIYV